MNNFRLSDVPSKNENIVSRHIAGELLLVPISQNIGEVSEIYTLNEIGAFIWKHIDGCTDISGLLYKVLSEFDIEKPIAQKDILELLNEGRKIGLLC